ncbi:MAG: aa3-type cytochrome c oxidase subunit IV [Alphaproteobacteria bacterium]|nr:aa3-type cytochrome c oxidase subunit IV [Alphaproteobacteria bacterium]
MAAAQHQHGEMDISEHRETWGTFITLTKWTTGIVIAIVALMAVFLT